MKVIPLIFLSFGLAMGCPAATDKSSEIHALSFEEAAKIALTENLDLVAVRLQSESLGIRSLQALSPNNPVLVYNQNDNYSGASAPAIPVSGFASAVLQVTWTLGFPGKALTQSAALRHQSAALKYQAVSKEIDTLAALSNNYVALSVNEKLFHFLTETKTKAEELLKLSEKKYATAQAAQVDLLNAKVVVANLEQSILVNRDERELLLNGFLNLIRRPGSLEIQPQIPSEILIPEIKESAAELEQIMLKRRHLLKAAHEQVEAAESQLTSASLTALPDFQFSISKNHYRNPRASPVDDTVQDDYSFGIGIAIPLFFPLNELSGIRAARRDRDVAKAQEDSQRLQAISDLRSVHTHFVALQKEIDSLTKLVIPAAQSAYKLTVLTYSLGKADYFRLNDARTTLIEAEKSLLSKKQDAAQSFTQITQQLGCDITRKEGPYVCGESQNKNRVKGHARVFSYFVTGMISVSLLSCTQAAPEVPDVERVSNDTVKLSADAIKNIKTTPVVSADFPEYLSVMGRISIPEDRVSVIPARVSGRTDAVGVASGEEVKAGQVLATIFSSDYAVAREEYLQALQQSRDSAGKSDGLNLVNLAKRKLVNLGLSAQDIEDLPSASELKSSSFLVRATRGGVVIDKKAVIGNFVNQGDTLFTIGDLRKVWFAGDVYPENLAKVHKDQEVTIDSGTPGETIRGQVSFISPVIDPNTRTIKIRALMDNPGHGLRADMYVNGKVIISKKNALVIPSKSIIRFHDSFSIYTKEPDGKFKRTPVAIMGEEKDLTALKEGVKAGDEVVSEGALLLEAALSNTGT